MHDEFIPINCAFVLSLILIVSLLLYAVHGHVLVQSIASAKKAAEENGLIFLIRGTRDV